MHAHVCYRGRSSCMPLHFRPHFRIATFLPKQSADTPRVAIAGGQKGSRETRVAIARRDSAAKKNIFHLPQEEAVAILCRVGIHGCRNCIYDSKIYDSVVYLLMKLAQFWYFGHVSKSLVAKSTTAVNPNPDVYLMISLPFYRSPSCC